jgi:putative alpha-1,2-mannosidase
MVPFDVPGLASRMGGREVAIARLDGFFSQLNAGPDSPYGWIGNEPGLSAPWAYNALGAPARTQAVLRRIQTELFSPTPGGLPGNDDGGTLSAWYVFSALGLFPATPGLDELQIATPVFDDAVIDRGAGQHVHLVGNGQGPYVRGLRLNGQPYFRWSIAWSDLADATLEFERSVDQAVLAEGNQE